MRKFLINFISIILLTIAILLLLLRPSIVFSSVNQALYLWTTRVFPVLFPFIILCQISIDLGLVNIISKIVQPINKILFRTSKKCGFIFLFSLFSGNPSGAMMIQKMLENNEITKKEAGILLNYTSFISPIFAIGTIGYAFFGNVVIGYIVLLAHILGNVIIGVVLGISIKNQRNEKTHYIKQKDKTINKEKELKKSIGEILSDKLQHGINIMFLICGFMIIFTILINYLSSIMDNINISIPSVRLLLFGMLEMVSSVNYIYENISSTQLTVAFITSSISFAGLCIHSQVYVFISKAKLKYIPFLISRITHAIISGIIAYILYPIIIKDDVTNTFSNMCEENNINNNYIFISIIMIICYLCYEIIVSIKKSDKKFIT